ncbi:MAG: hypothetical protein MJ051_08010 [Akkermansia sp.]|nr:hypothetical protein [Akkermansia sp.]
MPPEPSVEQDVSTEAQRQALDAMSADLISKLNSMIEEQNARVQTFATQYPQQAEQMQEQMQQQTAPTPAPAPAPQPEAPQPETVAYRQTPRLQKSVTPPPVAKPRTETPPPVRMQHAPAKPKTVAPAKGKDESSIGCGKLIVIIAVIVILLRCCN